MKVCVFHKHSQSSSKQMQTQQFTGFSSQCPTPPCNGQLMFKARYGLFKMAQGTVNMSKLPICRCLGLRVVEFMGYNKPLLKAHKSLLQVTKTLMRVPQSTICPLLVPCTLQLQTDSKMLLMTLDGLIQISQCVIAVTQVAKCSSLEKQVAQS
jgi:hypothetical protein